MNEAIDNVANCPFVGCARHRFNLTVQDNIDDHQTEMTMVNNLITKWKYLIQAAKRRKIKALSAVIRNDARWSSAFSMLKYIWKLWISSKYLIKLMIFLNTYCRVGPETVLFKIFINI